MFTKSFALALLLLLSPAALGQTTWNPSDKSASVALTGGNLIATQGTSATSFQAVRSTTSYTTGASEKRIFTTTVTGLDNVQGWIGGLADGTMALTSYPGGSGVSAGIQAGNPNGYYNTGTVTRNAANQLGGGAVVGATVLWWAVDFNTGNVWVSVDCMAWTSSGNPDAGGAPVYVLPGATAFFAAWSGYHGAGADDAVTLNTSPSLVGCTSVATYQPWDSVVASSAGRVFGWP